jgi:hypothetical protein
MSGQRIPSQHLAAMQEQVEEGTVSYPPEAKTSHSRAREALDGALNEALAGRMTGEIVVRATMNNGGVRKVYVTVTLEK